VGELLDFYGPDCMLLVGGSLYEAADALAGRTRELVDRLARAAAEESVR
jgi:ribulose-bisphosphate carboxylase large chain